MSDAIAVELDAQYRQLREECGLLDRSERGKLIVSGPEAAEYLQGQLTNDVEAPSPGEGRYAALLDRKGHMQADMRLLRTADEDFWIDTEAGALAAARRHLEMYKIGREAAVADVSEERAILSLIGPRSAELAGTAALPEFACEASAVEGVECLAVGTDAGIDLIAKAADAARLREALLAAGAAEVGPEAAEIAADRGGHAALRRRDERRDDARRGRDRRARRQLHQGLLHRPGAGRPAPLQGQAEPPSARARAERPRGAGRAPATGREGGRPGRQQPPSPPPAARSRWRSFAARPSRAASSP